MYRELNDIERDWELLLSVSVNGIAWRLPNCRRREWLSHLPWCSACHRNRRDRSSSPHNLLSGDWSSGSLSSVRVILSGDPASSCSPHECIFAAPHSSLLLSPSCIHVPQSWRSTSSLEDPRTRRLVQRRSRPWTCRVLFGLHHREMGKRWDNPTSRRAPFVQTCRGRRLPSWFRRRGYRCPWTVASLVIRSEPSRSCSGNHTSAPYCCLGSWTRSRLVCSVEWTSSSARCLWSPQWTSSSIWNWAAKRVSFSCARRSRALRRPCCVGSRLSSRTRCYSLAWRNPCRRGLRHSACARC